MPFSTGLSSVCSISRPAKHGRPSSSPPHHTIGSSSGAGPSNAPDQATTIQQLTRRLLHQDLIIQKQRRQKRTVRQRNAALSLALYRVRQRDLRKRLRQAGVEEGPAMDRAVERELSNLADDDMYRSWIFQHEYGSDPASFGYLREDGTISWRHLRAYLRAGGRCRVYPSTPRGEILFDQVLALILYLNLSIAKLMSDALITSPNGRAYKMTYESFDSLEDAMQGSDKDLKDIGGDLVHSGFLLAYQESAFYVPAPTRARRLRTDRAKAKRAANQRVVRQRQRELVVPPQIAALARREVRDNNNNNNTRGRHVPLKIQLLADRTRRQRQRERYESNRLVRRAFDSSNKRPRVGDDKRIIKDTSHATSLGSLYIPAGREGLCVLECIKKKCHVSPQLENALATYFLKYPKGESKN